MIIHLKTSLLSHIHTKGKILFTTIHLYNAYIFQCLYQCITLGYIHDWYTYNIKYYMNRDQWFVFIDKKKLTD